MSDQPNRSNARGGAIAVDDVDQASLDSFPASDPPKWGGFRVGPPAPSEVARAAEEKTSKYVQARPEDEQRALARAHGATQ